VTYAPSSSSSRRLRLQPRSTASVFNLEHASLHLSSNKPPLQPCPPPRCAATPGSFYPRWCRPSPINHNPNFDPWTLPPPPTLIHHVPPSSPTLESESPASTSLKEERSRGDRCVRRPSHVRVTTCKCAISRSLWYHLRFQRKLCSTRCRSSW
jgi:hypothetical protein